MPEIGLDSDARCSLDPSENLENGINFDPQEAAARGPGSICPAGVIQNCLLLPRGKP